MEGVKLFRVDLAWSGHFEGSLVISVGSDEVVRKDSSSLRDLKHKREGLLRLGACYQMLFVSCMVCFVIRRLVPGALCLQTESLDCSISQCGKMKILCVPLASRVFSWHYPISVWLKSETLPTSIDND